MLRLPVVLIAVLFVAGCAMIPRPIAVQPEPQALLFDTDSSKLRPAAAAYLDQLSDFLNRHPEYDVVIEGYTDSTASDEYNLKLSQRRAQAVQSRLAANGVSPNRTTAVAYGEQRPADDNKKAEGRQQNRRVVVSTIRREMPVMAAPISGPPKYNYTSTDPKIEGMAHNSGVRPTHR